MTTVLKYLAMLPLTAGLIIGCSDSNDNTSSQTSNPSDNGSGQFSVLTKFDGNYFQGCSLSDPEVREDGAEVSTYTISGTTGSLRLLSYTDSNCTIPGDPAEILFEVSIAYPGGAVNTSRGVADFVDVTTESITFDGQPPTPQQLAILNQVGSFDTEYNIFLLDGGLLYFGEYVGDLDGNSPDKRPDTLDDVPAVRQ